MHLNRASYTLLFTFSTRLSGRIKSTNLCATSKLLKPFEGIPLSAPVLHRAVLHHADLIICMQVDYILLG